MANLRIHRGGVCAVTLNSEVYAIGGNDGVQSKACCEKYSPLLDRWEDIPLMQQRRAGAGATVANGKEKFYFYIQHLILSNKVQKYFVNKSHPRTS